SRFSFVFAQQPDSRESLRLHGDEGTAVRTQTQLGIITQIACDSALRSAAKQLPDLHERPAVSFREHDHAVALGMDSHTAKLVKFLRRKRNYVFRAIRQILFK